MGATAKGYDSITEWRECVNNLCQICFDKKVEDFFDGVFPGEVDNFYWHGWGAFDTLTKLTNILYISGKVELPELEEWAAAQSVKNGGE